MLIEVQTLHGARWVNPAEIKSLRPSDSHIRHTTVEFTDGTAITVKGYPWEVATVLNGLPPLTDQEARGLTADNS